MWATYFNLRDGHTWRVYTADNDPLVDVFQRLSGLRDCLELCVVLIADDDFGGRWERQEGQVVSFVKDCGYAAHERNVFAVIAKGTMARFYLLDRERGVEALPGSLRRGRMGYGGLGGIDGRYGEAL